MGASDLLRILDEHMDAHIQGYHDAAWRANVDLDLPGAGLCLTDGQSRAACWEGRRMARVVKLLLAELGTDAIAADAAAGRWAHG